MPWSDGKKDRPCAYCDKLFWTHGEVHNHILEAHPGKPIRHPDMGDEKAKEETDLDKQR